MQYLAGLPHDEIAVSNSVSKGSVSNTVSDLKEGIIPEAADVAEQHLIASRPFPGPQEVKPELEVRPLVLAFTKCNDHTGKMFDQ